MPAMTEQMAREIVDAAIKTGAWEEPGETAVSLTAERAFKEAEALVQTARVVYDKYNSDPDSRETNFPHGLPQAVSDILFAAQVEPVDGKYADIYESHGATPPVNGSAPAGGSAFDQPTVDAPDSIEHIFPGYDDKNSKEIIAAIKDSAASGDLTLDEWRQIKAYEEAHEERKGILSLTPDFKPAESPPPPPQQGPRSAGPGALGDYGSSDDLRSAYEGGSLGTDRVEQERLPVPTAAVDQSISLPVDITSVSDQELSRLMMTFHSLEARTLWLVSQEEGRQEACKSLRHDSHRAAFARDFERLKSGIDTSKATHVEAAKSDANRLADDDQSVKTWRNREIRHGIEARSLKALSDGYGNAAARLSRELTRRTELRQTPTGG